MHRQEITPGVFSYAAEGLVERDDTGEHTSLGLCHRVLCLKLGTFGIKQSEKVDYSFAIAHASDRCGAGALARLLGELDQALLLLVVVDEGVLRFLERAQDDLLEFGHRLARDALRAAKPRARTPPVESGPTQCRRDRPGTSVRDIEQVPSTGTEAKR